MKLFSANGFLPDFLPPSPVHREQQPHEYGFAWTLSRSHGPEAGGNFFITRYRIRVEGAANTLVIWRPADWHGTSLQDFSPFSRDPEFTSRGVAIVTSSRLKGVWGRYQAGQMSLEEVKEELVKGNAGEPEEDFGNQTSRQK